MYEKRAIISAKKIARKLLKDRDDLEDFKMRLATLSESSTQVLIGDIWGKSS